ncbi:MAG TPA: dihydroxyacetone kinase phosphoryl donor subunit DhaM [Acidocella sp.]|jgi:phosphocarrier protein FPr|nr:dihydroxyacetone kinase phosphoryl donor subunit DhaM [Acidocella sp.]
MSVGLLLVSHSAGLAEATERLVRQMTGDRLRLQIAAGTGTDADALGTDATAILAACEALRDCTEIVILMDIGGAILSAELARDLADEELQRKIHFSAAPFVEGAIAAGVAAAAGLEVTHVLAEAESGLMQKQSCLGAAPTTDAEPQPGAAPVTREVVIADPHGLHLRPAAAFVKLAAASKAEIALRLGARRARGDSLTSLMTLGAAAGTVVTIEAAGPDAHEVAEALCRLLEQAPQTSPSAAQEGSGPLCLSPGTAAGNLFVVERPTHEIPRLPATDRQAARHRLETALRAATATLAGNPILEAQAALLADPELREAAFRRIAQDGQNEAAAWHAAITALAAAYDRLETPYLRARARDVTEAGAAVLRSLLGGSQHDIAWPTHPAIILIEDLSAAEAACLPATVLGVLDRRGGLSSHATILLRAAGIPALGNVILEPIPSSIAFDGATGAMFPDPDASTIASLISTPAATCGPSTLPLADGSRLELWANVSGEADATAAARANAYGIGLARTEMLFLGRSDAPSEAEQEARIAKMLHPFAGRPVTVRVLDAGADKPVPFLHLSPETNPALGIRGIRALLRHKDFFAAHLRAILRAGAGHDLRIMIPMVSVADEMDAARDLLAAAAREVGATIPALGAMIEVPAAAIRIQDLAPAADFFSIGTNDLTQYVFAADREEAAFLADPAHQAILDLCAAIVRGAGAKPVSVCGEAAGDARTAKLLAGVGIRRLSMGAARLGAIRAAFSA